MNRISGIHPCGKNGFFYPVNQNNDYNPGRPGRYSLMMKYKELTENK
jgi:hypothetical protein